MTKFSINFFKRKLVKLSPNLIELTQVKLVKHFNFIKNRIYVQINASLIVNSTS